MSPFIESFNRAVEDAEIYLSIARDSNLQRDAIKKIDELKAEVSQEKSRAVMEGNEDYANQLLGCECVADMLIAELRMWILLKDERPNDAWDQLVTAQMCSTSAARAHGSFAHLEHQNARLLAIEKLVFPPQVFVSSGMLVHKQECSICGGEYEDCDHLVGKPYMGEFCIIIARDLEIDHVSVVDNPADKRCRVRESNVEGGIRDRMTWRIEPVENGT